MSDPTSFDRRTFVKQSAAAGVAAPVVVSAAALGLEERPPAGDRVAIGLVGCGGMGMGNLRACAAHADVVVRALCDVQPSRLDAAVAKHEDTAKGYRDYRDLLARKDLDAVIIATPPHWHALQAIEACEQGKDIYLQKPMTLHLGESLAVRNAVRKHGRISQVGTQIHASENYRRVVEYVRSGKLGPVPVVRTFNVMNQGPDGVGRGGDGDVPPGVDWEMWIGPGPKRPYNRILAANSYNHCSFMDYSGGWTPGMAPHIIDLPVWALDLPLPSRVSCSGGRYVIRDDGDAPDVQEILWQYPDRTMTWMGVLVSSYAWDFGSGTPARRLGIYFHGVNATLYSNYGMHEVVPEGDRLADAAPPEKSIPRSPGHEREWLDCIKSRRQPSCCVDYHVRIDIPIVLGNLAYRLKRSIDFDPGAERIVGDDEAAHLAVPEYRDPWKFPQEYLEG